jgi:YidC/Oxa1 family membrane protein insertase
MDKIRIFLWSALGVLLWFNLITWQRDYPDAVAPTATETPSSAQTSSLPSLPQASSSSAATAALQTTGTSPLPGNAPVAPAAAARKIHVTTDVLDLDINTRGGDIERADLVRYTLNKDQPTTPMRLLDDRAMSLFIAHSGLLAPDQALAPSHLANFSADADSYQLTAGANDLTVALHWMNDGVTVTKTYVLHRGSYAIEVRYAVNNNSTSEWQGASYVQLFRHDLPVSRSMFNAETISSRGPAIWDGKSYRKLNIKSAEDQKYQAAFTSGWMAAIQHHFVVAAVPSGEQSYDYSLSTDTNNDFTLTYRGPLQTVAPGATGMFAEKLYVGPKLQDQLTATGPNLERTADYGKLTIIAQPLFWLLKKVNQFIGNWGVDIIIVTLLIKLAFYKLTAASGRSMAKMRTLAPRIKSVQERYKDDREQLGRAMMELYKREKINPVAGCLPMLIQMPFFLGFYWVLLESAEMHQAPFIAWITDLSARDPYFVLPIIMGIANFAQFKMNPPPPDPTQAKVMAIMPVVMTVMMAWFPAGLVLYWITNTVTSALQQWRINQLVAADAKRAVT